MTVTLTNATINLTTNSGATTISGSGDTVNGGYGDQAYIYGSSDLLILANADLASILAGSSDSVYVSSGVLDLANNLSSTLLDGTGDTVYGGTGDSLSVFGGGDELVLSGPADTISLLSNNNDVFMSTGVVDTYNNVTGSLIDGTNDSVSAGTLNSMSIFGGNDLISAAGTGDSVSLLSNSNTVYMTSGVLATYTNVTGSILYGANNTINAAAGNQININGNSNIANMANGDAVSLWGGGGNYINLSSGVLTISAYVGGNLLTGSSSTINAQAGVQVDINGNSNIANMANGDSVSLWGGGGNYIYLSSGVLDLSPNVGGNELLGSYNTISAMAGAQLDINGNSNVANMTNGDSVSLWGGGGNYVNLNYGVLDISPYVGGNLLTGSNSTISAMTGVQVDISGNSDVANMTTGDSVSLWAGNADDVYLNSGIVTIGNSVTNIILTGSNDTVNAALSDQISIWGSSDIFNMGVASSVGLQAGNADDVYMNSGSITMGNSVTNAVLTGSNDVVNAYLNDQISVWGSSDVFNMGGTSSVGLQAGNADDVYMNSGSITMGNSVTNAILTGSNDVVNAYLNDQISVWGSNDVFNMGNTSSVGLQSGNGDSVNMNFGAITMGNSVTNAILTGSDDQLSGYQNDSALVTGNTDSLSMGTGSYVGVESGNGFTINMGGSSLNVTGGVTNVDLNGSNNTVSLGAGAYLAVAGNNDVINATEGATVTLTAGDSGDTINLIGGTIVVGSTLVSGITINGTGDVFSGAGASLAGPITTTVTEHTGAGGVPTFVTVTTVPQIVYNAGDIADLVTYFEANPNLSGDQIKAAESDSNFTLSLDNYLSSANVYGSSNSLPSNVLAMLDGYSNIEMALIGVSGTVLSEETYIEQQLGWVEANYPIPQDLLQGDIQNLMPALVSGSTLTQGLITEAIGYLEDGQAGYAANPTSNQAPMLDDTIAEMVLSIAENPSFSQSGLLSEEVYTPGRTGHWQIEVQGNGVLVQETFKSPPLISTVLDDIDTYVGPLIDLLAVVTANPELIPLASLIGTGAAAALETGFQIAATAFTAVEAGQDFATGEDLDGAFSALAAIGGGLSEIGAATRDTTEELLGGILSNGVSAVQGAYNVSISVETGNILGAISGALGAVGGVAGVDEGTSALDNTLTEAALQSDTEVQQFAALGAGLASSIQSGESGNIIAALTSLLQSSISYQNLGGLSGIVQDVQYLIGGFETGLTNLYSSLIVNNIASAAAGVPSGAGSGWITTVSLRNTTGFEMYGPDSSKEPGNSIIAPDVANLPSTPGVYVVGAHGEPLWVAAFDGTQIDAQELASVIKMDPNYQSGETVQLYACNTGASPTTMQLLDPGSMMGTPNFAEQLSSYLNNATVVAPTNYIWFTPNNENPTIAPAINSQGNLVAYVANQGDVEGTPVQNGWQSFNSHGPI